MSELTYVSDGVFTHYLGVPPMRNCFTVVITCFLGLLLQISVCAADVNSSWIDLGQASVKKFQSSGTVVYQPLLSIEENNQLLERHRADTVTVTAAIPSGRVRGQNWINRPAKFTIQNRTYEGRISAVIISPDGIATIFAIAENKNKSERWQLVSGETGRLSIVGETGTID